MNAKRCAPAVAGILIMVLVAATPARADRHLAASADFIRTLADRAITTLTADELTPEQRREQFRRLFRDGFAVNGIARFVLGRYWRTASEEEREEYLNLFEDVIVNTWADRFSQYSGQEFQVKDAVDAPSARASEQAAIVRSVFYTDPQTPVRIDWRVASKGDVFKIADVLIEGISMANTQRDEFASVIRQDSGQLSGLFDRLRKMREGDQG